MVGFLVMTPFWPKNGHFNVFLKKNELNPVGFDVLERNRTRWSRIFGSGNSKTSNGHVVALFWPKIGPFSNFFEKSQSIWLVMLFSGVIRPANPEFLGAGNRKCPKATWWPFFDPKWALLAIFLRQVDLSG